MVHYDYGILNTCYVILTQVASLVETLLHFSRHIHKVCLQMKLRSMNFLICRTESPLQCDFVIRANVMK